MRFFLVASFLFGWAVSAVAGPDTRDWKNGHTMIAVPAGEYVVGEVGHAANPKCDVEVKAFLIADAETTNAQFAEFVRQTHYVTDAERRGYAMVFREGMMDWEWEKVAGACWRFPRGPADSEAPPGHPVTQISGSDAQAYCQWLGARLPTLEEWEIAARAGSAERFPWGEKFDPAQANIWNGKSHRRNTQEDGYLYTAPVRSFPPNTWGLHDAIGNVFEYCTESSPPKSGTTIAARGGSWWCSAGTCGFYNLVDIGVMNFGAAFANQGFRVAADAPEK